MGTSATATTPTLHWDSATDQGPRKDNQDRVTLVAENHPLLDSRGALLVLCDGVGGEEGGHIAAQIATDEAQRVYYTENGFEVPMLLRLAVDRAWLAVKNAAAVTPQQARMATTIVAVVVHGGVLHVAHVGDSRAYLMRGGQLRQLTDDHTYVNQQIKQGMITPDEAKRSAYRGVLTRSLAAATDHTPDVGSEILQPGDRVLLCSDGLHGVVEPKQIEQILNGELETSTAAQRLVGVALQNKTGDNVTVAVLNYGLAVTKRGAAHAAATTAAMRSTIPQPMPERRRSIAPILIGGIVLAGLIGAAAYALPTLLQPPQVTALPKSVSTATLAAAVIAPTQPPKSVVAPEATALPTVAAAIATSEPVPGAPTATQAIAKPTSTRRPPPTATRVPTKTPTPLPATSTPIPTLATTTVPVVTAVPPKQEQAPPNPNPPAPENTAPPRPPDPPPAQPQPTAPPAENPVDTPPGLPGATIVP